MLVDWVTLIPFGLFLILNGFLAWRLWSRPVALLSVGWLAIALWWWPPEQWSGWLLCGTAATLLSFTPTPTVIRRWAQLFFLGLLLGLGAWLNLAILFYALPLTAVWLLTSPEWHKFEQVVPILYWRWGAAGSWLLLVLSLFANQCAGGYWLTVIEISRLLLLAVLGWAAVGYMWQSKRADQFIWGGVAVSVGLILGHIALWPGWLPYALWPVPLPESCPTVWPVSAWQLVSQLPWAGGPAGVAQLFFGGVNLLAMAYLLWRYPAVLLKLVGFSGLKSEERPVAWLFALALLVVGWQWLAHQPLATDHLILLWQVGGLTAGAVLTRWWQ